jgi:hypothetical protein
MVQRSLLVACLAILAVVLAVCFWYPPAHTPGVTKVNFQRIRPGMMLSEVLDLMGGRPKSSGHIWAGCFLGEIQTDRAEWDSGRAPVLNASWYLGHENGFVTVGVGLNEDGKVVQADYYWWWYGAGRPSVLDRMRAWLGW